ncbi:energy transducer TonB [Kangiella shandongensis]|uniref:energy transducer TonB n=1 Tax=Kangiella shandongensis TaxID=2763258 RepID=UPI001CBE935D|nr:energy transducer TonB [Kangiella shandongensis]
MRIMISVLIAAIVTTALLFLMSLFIKDEQVKSEPQPEPVELSNLTMPEEKPEPPKSRPEPPKLPVIEQTPSTTGQVIETAEVEVDAESFSTLVPEVAPLTGVSIGLEGMLAVQDASVMPMYRTQPNYPVKAQIEGVEGWVLLKYDVDASGTLSNISVMDSEPRKIFDREAMRALKKWKFKPALSNGQSVASRGQTVKIEFNMDNQ